MEKENENEIDRLKRKAN